MKLTSIFLGCVLLALTLGPLNTVHASSNKQNQAKAYYFAAEESYENKNYDAAMKSIKKVEKLLGKSNVTLSALRVKVLFGQRKYKDAKMELNLFYEYNSKKALAKEMASYIIKIDEEIEKARTTLGTITMVSIPSGSFQMGDIQGSADDTEKPVHRVSIKAFKMGQTEVTFVQWDTCVSEGGCTHKPEDNGWGRGNRPVVNVSYDDITKQYIPWLNRITGQMFRLPSEAEWEYTARAGSTTKYSWGNSIDCSKARYGYFFNVCGKQKSTDPVKSFSANKFGLYDMHGNVYEWTQDCFNDSYSNAPTDGRARISSQCTQRVLRGGSWSTAPWFLRSSNRIRFAASNRLYNIGFRIAQDAP